MKNEKQTSNLNVNVQLFLKSENHLFWCFLSQLQYRNEDQKFISNFIFQLTKKQKQKRNSTLGTRIRMVFIEHNSLKSDIFFYPMFIPCFSGFMLFKV